MFLCFLLSRLFFLRVVSSGDQNRERKRGEKQTKKEHRRRKPLFVSTLFCRLWWCGWAWRIKVIVEQRWAPTLYQDLASHLVFRWTSASQWTPFDSVLRLTWPTVSPAWSKAQWTKKQINVFGNISCGNYTVQSSFVLAFRDHRTVPSRMHYRTFR